MFDFLKELVKPKLAEGYYIPIGSPIGTSTRRNLCSEGISNDPSELSSWHHDNLHFAIGSKASTLQPLHEGDVMWHARRAIPNSKPSISNMPKQILKCSESGMTSQQIWKQGSLNNNLQTSTLSHAQDLPPSSTPLLACRDTIPTSPPTHSLSPGTCWHHHTYWLSPTSFSWPNLVLRISFIIISTTTKHVHRTTVKASCYPTFLLGSDAFTASTSWFNHSLSPPWKIVAKVVRPNTARNTRSSTDSTKESTSSITKSDLKICQVAWRKLRVSVAWNLHHCEQHDHTSTCTLACTHLFAQQLWGGSLPDTTRRHVHCQP